MKDTKYYAVEGNSDLVKDQNGVIHNINSNKLADAKQRKLLKQKENQKIKSLENEISELKDLVKTLINNKD
jgi:hypothetical protein